MNIIAANFVSLFGGLLWEILCRRKMSSFSYQRYAFYFHLLNFLPLFTDLTSMSTLCYNRYENATKFPAERRLSFGKSVKVVAFSWVLPIVLIPIKDDLLQGDTSCRMQCNKTLTTWDIAPLSALILLVTLSIAVNSRIIRKSLWKIYTKLKKDRQETENILGPTRTEQDVNLKKQAV